MMGYNTFGQVQTPLYSPQQMQNQIIWVQGEAGAKSFLVAPNTTVALWDSESQTIYLKSVDATGMPSMKYIDYTIRDASNVPKSESYISREEFDGLKNEIETMKKSLADLLN